MVDRFVKRPDEFTFQRFKISGLRSSIYKEYCKIINAGPNQTVVQLVKPLAQFIGNLPDFTQKTRSSDLSSKAKKVRDAFNLAKSPVHLIFEDIPKALGYEKELENFLMALNEFLLTFFRNSCYVHPRNQPLTLLEKLT